MSKLLKFSDDAKNAIERGVDVLTNAVKVTLGPKGRNVVLGKDYTSPVITNDGVTIAREIELEDEFENVGAELVKEAAIKTNDVAGDGTTTATILAGAMIKEGLKYVRNSANPMILKKGIEKTVKLITEEIVNVATPIKGKEDIAKIATISASDEEIGNIIAEAMEKVTTSGVITVEESNKVTTELEIVSGTRIDRGYISSYMVTDTEKMEAVLENPYILITDKKISSVQEILPIIEQVVKEERKLVIIAEDIEKEVLSTLIVNKLRGIFTSVCIKAPSFGKRRKDILDDLAILTGARVISEEVGESLKDISVDDLGSAKQVKVLKDYTDIIDGVGDKDEISKRIENLNKLLENEKEEYEKEIIKERIAKLSEGAAIIRVGCTTETEMKDKKLRIEDALAGAKAASKEGIVAGGGVTYLKIKKKVEEKIDLVGDEKLGANIVLNALEAPIRQILYNAGKEPPVIIDKIYELGEDMGYDALNSKFVNMKESGIIDPAKVTRSALQNAASIASMVITTEVICVEETQKEKMPQEIV